jgi:non-ribosomal peptide synthetase-like protein
MPALTESLIIGSVRPDLLLNETLADMFRESARRLPQKTALVFEDESLSYSELDAWSDEIAVFLQVQGIGRGQYVGLWWPRGLALHAAILGIVKSGAAYVPIDREMPVDRVITVMEEVGASALLADKQLSTACPVFEVPAFERKSDLPVPQGPLPDNDAYVLYTSGSTGKPKGIPITQRNICHFVRAEQSVLEVQESDRVYQGFSVSFDMWCEETWISFFVGATLFLADATTAKSVDELGAWLRSKDITVLHAVPSLLAVIESDQPKLRLVNAGGEACTTQVVNEWAVDGRRFYNSYGPTETTVTATLIQLHPGEPISIGDPLPNYNLAVIDEAGKLLPVGQRGELVISGPGLSKGYVGRPELNKEKFITKPASLAEMPGDRIYRSGDAVAFEPDGTVLFQGRMDDQIKLRGYRIELGEIESKLSAIDGVAAAAVAVKKDGTDQDTLVGYVVMNDDAGFDESALRVALARALPSYMVPALVTPLFSMPRLPSGKIDRKSLPVPDSLMLVHTDMSDEPIDLNAPVGDRIFQLLNKVFPGRHIDASQDFFNDLGGHSLLAAVVVSRLRKEAGLKQASLKDIYLHRPLAKLVEAWSEEVPETAKEPRKIRPVNKTAHWLCGAAQTMVLPIIYGLFAMQIFLPYLSYYYVYNLLVEERYFELHETVAYGYSIATAFAMFAFMPLFFSALVIVCKWLIIGRMKEGDYPLWGFYYFRWWLVKTLERLSPAQYLSGSPLLPGYLNMLGAKIHPSAQLSAFRVGATDLLTIGADVTISSQAVINNAWVEDGMLRLRQVTLGDHAYLGSSAVVGGGSSVEDWGELQDLSCLPADGKIARAEVWQGSPAVRKFTRKEEELMQPLEISVGRRLWYRLIFSLSLFVFPVFILLPLLPTIITLHQLDNDADPYDFTYLLLTPSLALGYIILFALQTIIFTRWLQRDIKPGVHSIYSGFYVRKWLADQFMSIALIVLHPIYATVFVSWLFRALGAKVGKNTEISTASSVTHKLLEIGNGSFIADAVTLGEVDVRGQRLILDKTVIGNISFVGNSALIPQGYELPDHMLVGVLSTPPSPEQLKTEMARDYFGSPAIPLPRRQESQTFPESLTTFPPAHRKIARSIVELVRVLIPETVVITLSVIFIAYGHDLVTQWPWWKAALGVPFLYLLIMGLPAFLVTLFLKWLFAGVYREGSHPMWTWTVWRSEAITTTYEALAVPFFLEYLQGTPWLPVMLRTLGVKIGERVWLNTTDITEFDMVTIDDEAQLNEECGPQTHLFEDRVMKVGPVHIGPRSTIGSRTIILYDSEIGADVRVDPLSLVMKGEKLPDGTEWRGSPVRAS